MSEGPTATPEPVPWGDEDDPFPDGTVISIPCHAEGAPDRREVAVETEENGAGGKIVYVGLGFSPEEVQGRIDEWGWEVVGHADGEGGER